ncbi:MAG: NAD(P)H-dependent oxidoreductase [Polyangiales bacterium]
MTTILEITSSPRGSASRSNQLVRELSDALQDRHPGARVVRRDLAADPVLALDADLLGAFFASERTPLQARLVAQSDALIAEIQAADVVVLGIPMYNFSVPTQLKSYFDAIARAGLTFRYTPNGPEGLLRGKQVYVVFTRGGKHRGTSSDVQTPYVRQFLGFVGLTDVELVFAEGLDMGPEALAAGLAEARRDIARLTAAPSARAA